MPRGKEKDDKKATPHTPKKIEDESFRLKRDDLANRRRYGEEERQTEEGVGVEKGKERRKGEGSNRKKGKQNEEDEERGILEQVEAIDAREREKEREKLNDMVVRLVDLAQEMVEMTRKVAEAVL